MFARIGWYLLFLVALAIYISLLAYWQNMQKKYPEAARSLTGKFLVNQIQIVAGLIPIVAIPWILTGFFSRNFLLLVLAAFEISSLLTYVFTSKESGLRSKLWWAETTGILSAPAPEQLRGLPFKAVWRTSKRVLLFLVALILMVLVSIIYFIIATYVYFTNPLHSDIAVHKILTLNLGLYVGGALVAAISNIPQLSSRQINDNTRRALFLTQAAYALQIGTILTVYLGLIGISGERFVPQSLILPAAYTRYVPFVALTIFYLLILVLPYLAGLAGRRRAQVSLYQTILKWITTIIEAVGIPSHRDPDQLAHLRDEFNRETDTWIENERMVKDLALKVERAPAKDQLSKPLQDYVDAYQILKDQDSRFLRFTWTEAIKAKLDEMIDEYTRFASQPNQAAASR